MTGIHIDGNVNEATHTLNDGPRDLHVDGVVFGGNCNYDVHIAAGERQSFVRCHFEGYGNGATVTPYSIRVSNEGGEGPLATTFERCSWFSTQTNNMFLLENCNRTRFLRCKGDSRIGHGGRVTATASNTRFISGDLADDFRCNRFLGGMHTAAMHATQLTDAAATFVANGVTVGWAVWNITDGSCGRITQIIGQNDLVVEALRGGATNQFNLNDVYSIVKSGISVETGGSADVVWEQDDVDNETGHRPMARGPNAYVRYTDDGVIQVIKDAVGKYVLSSRLLDESNPRWVVLATGRQYYNTGTSGVPQVVEHIRDSYTSAGVGPYTLWSAALDDGTALAIHAWVVGRKSDGTDRAMYAKRVLVYRQGAGAVLEGAVQDMHPDVESNAAWACTFDVNGNDVRLRVTGVALTDIDWVCRISYQIVPIV